MRTAPPITAVLAVLVLASLAPPTVAARERNVTLSAGPAGPSIAAPPWTLHPQPIAEAVSAVDTTPIPRSLSTSADEGQEYVSLGRAVAHAAREQRAEALHLTGRASATVRAPRVTPDDRAGVDWGSAGIGAAVTLAGLALAFAGVGAWRHRAVVRLRD